MVLRSKYEKYKVIREDGKARVVPVNFDAMDARLKEKKETKTKSLDEQVKEQLKKERNRKVDARRKKLKKAGKTVKKVWDYLGETQLAKQSSKTSSSSGNSKRRKKKTYGFENPDNWW